MYEVHRLSRPILSIVCPIHKMSGKLAYLKAWVTEATANDEIQVILVHDEGDAGTRYELEDFLMSLDRKPVLLTGKFGSPGAARNQALDLIEGKWTIFWDSDDVPNLEATLRLIQESTEKELVLVGQYQENMYVQNYLTNTKPMTNNFFALSTNFGMWRVLFNSQLLKYLRFPNLSMAEDLSFAANLNINPKQIRYGKEVIYYYSVGFPDQLTSTKKFAQHNQEALFWVLSSLNSSNMKVHKFTLSLLSRMSLIDFPYQFRDRRIQQEILRLVSRRPRYLLLICWYSLRHLVVHRLEKFHRG